MLGIDAPVGQQARAGGRQRLQIVDQPRQLIVPPPRPGARVLARPVRERPPPNSIGTDDSPRSQLVALRHERRDLLDQDPGIGDPSFQRVDPVGVSRPQPPRFRDQVGVVLGEGQAQHLVRALPFGVGTGPGFPPLSPRRAERSPVLPGSGAPTPRWSTRGRGSAGRSSGPSPEITTNARAAPAAATLFAGLRFTHLMRRSPRVGARATIGSFERCRRMSAAKSLHRRVALAWVLLQGLLADHGEIPRDARAHRTYVRRIAQHDLLRDLMCRVPLERPA